MATIKLCLVYLTIFAATVCFATLSTSHKLSSQDWLLQHCKPYRNDYAAIVSNYWSRYRHGLKVEDMLSLKGPSGRYQLVDGMLNVRPVVYVANNTMFYVDSKLGNMTEKGMASAGFSTYFQPVIDRLLAEMLLPDMPIAFNPDDYPTSDEDVGGGPCMGYCNLPKITSNLPFPDLASVEPLSCGEACVPFSPTDHRQEQAIFLGRPTGWHKGTRRAIVQIGRKHPDYVYSGLTDYPDSGIVSPEDEQTFGITTNQPLSQQIAEHKYVVNVDGWCGSKRLKQLLASDSAILNLVSMEDEWYSPLLKPMQHYIPVRFEANDPELDEGTDLISKVKWAQEHPQELAKIVQHAKKFHSFYLSQKGEQCYAVQLLQEYSKLFVDAYKLQSLVGNNFTGK